MHTVEAEPGQDVASFAAELIEIAERTNAPVSGKFNQFTLEAKPGMTAREVMCPWQDGQRESYVKTPDLIDRAALLKKLVAMRDEYVHENFAYDPETGAWESNAAKEEYVSYLDENITLIETFPASQ